MTDGHIIRSVAKAIELLQLLSDSAQPLPLTEIAQRSGLPKSTVFGLLTTMRDYDVVAQGKDGRYTLGMRFLNMAAVSAVPGMYPTWRALTWSSWRPGSTSPQCCLSGKVITSSHWSR